MKNLFLVIASSVIMCTPALAVNVEVEALSDFSTNNPPQTYSVKIVEPINTKNGNIESGSIIEGKIIAIDAKRLKQDATFSFIPTYLVTPKGEVIKVKRNFIGNYRKEIDKKQIAKSAVLTAGNFAIKGFSTGVTAIEGAVKNEQGNVIKSTAVAVYEGSPLSYIQKGESLELKQGQHFYINFRLEDENEDGNNE